MEKFQEQVFDDNVHPVDSIRQCVIELHTRPDTQKPVQSFRLCFMHMLI